MVFCVCTLNCFRLSRNSLICFSLWTAAGSTAGAWARASVETVADRINTPTANQAAAIPLFPVLMSCLFRRLID